MRFVSWKRSYSASASTARSARASKRITCSAATSLGASWTGTYDAAGDLTCRAPTNTTTCSGGSPTGAQLSYDATGQLSHWQNAPGSSPTSTDGFLYDGEGNRVLQQSVVNGSTTTTTTYVSNLEEVALSGSTTTTTAYYYLGGKRVALSVNSTVSYLLDDGLGSAEVALDPSGNVQASQLYGPYGNARYTTGTMPGSYGFAGQRNDTAITGLDYDNARSYDPLIGQFASADTVSDGPDRYAYVGDNPVTHTDPTGHDCGFLCGAISAVSSAVQTVSTVVQAVAPTALQVVGTVTGVSSMISDVQTIVGAVQHGGNFWTVALAVGDLALNVAMDASMFTGVGELALGLHAAADIGEHLAADAAEHAVEDTVEHAAEDEAEHAAEDTAVRDMASARDACALSFAASTLVTTTTKGLKPIASLKAGD